MSSSLGCPRTQPAAVALPALCPSLGAGLRCHAESHGPCPGTGFPQQECLDGEDVSAWSPHAGTFASLRSTVAPGNPRTSPRTLGCPCVSTASPASFCPSHPLLAKIPPASLEASLRSPAGCPCPRSLVHPQHRSPTRRRCSPGTCPRAPSEGDVGIPGTGQLQGDAGFTHTHRTGTSPLDRHQCWPLAPGLPLARCARHTPGRSRLFLRTSPARRASAGSWPGSCTAVARVAPRLGGDQGSPVPARAA